MSGDVLGLPDWAREFVDYAGDHSDHRDICVHRQSERILKCEFVFDFIGESRQIVIDVCGERFAFFAKAVLECIRLMDDFTPDIIHSNDWQSARNTR